MYINPERNSEQIGNDQQNWKYLVSDNIMFESARNWPKVRHVHLSFIHVPLRNPFLETSIVFQFVLDPYALWKKVPAYKMVCTVSLWFSNSVYKE